MAEKEKFPIGIEDFEEIRTMEYYYVDKTGVIGTLLKNPGKVNLFTRPRRFGKSLNMSMLKYFFAQAVILRFLRACEFPGKQNSATGINLSGSGLRDR